MDRQQTESWKSLVSRLEAMQNSAAGSVLFHGTSSLRASMIIRDGFDPETSRVYLPDQDGALLRDSPCVFWTPRLEIALDRALRHDALVQGLPVVLSASVSDVVASGTAVPDYCMWEIDYHEDPAFLPTDWRESLDMLGSMAVLDCRRVDGLELHAVAPLEYRPTPEKYRAALERRGKAA